MMISTFCLQVSFHQTSWVVDEQVDTLFHTLKTQYDYIIVDTAPEFSADTLW
jgi:MinD-like ATPase involved in chromosome partitioning or flagellar assembly